MIAARKKQGEHLCVDPAVICNFGMKGEDFPRDGRLSSCHSSRSRCNSWCCMHRWAGLHTKVALSLFLFLSLPFFLVFFRISLRIIDAAHNCAWKIQRAQTRREDQRHRGASTQQHDIGQTRPLLPILDIVISQPYFAKTTKGWWLIVKLGQRLAYQQHALFPARIFFPPNRCCGLERQTPIFPAKPHGLRKNNNIYIRRARSSPVTRPTFHHLLSFPKRPWKIAREAWSSVKVDELGQHVKERKRERERGNGGKES